MKRCGHFPIGLHTTGASGGAPPPLVVRASTLASLFTLRRCRDQTFAATLREVFLIPEPILIGPVRFYSSGVISAERSQKDEERFEVFLRLKGFCEK